MKDRLKGNLLTINEAKTLLMILPWLSDGYEKQACSLLNDKDLTGGVVSIDDQVRALHSQYISSLKEV